MEDLGGTGGGGYERGNDWSRPRFTVSGRQGEAGRPLGTDRSSGKWRRIDWQVVLKEADEVVAGAATEMMTATEVMKMTEGGW